ADRRAEGGHGRKHARLRVDGNCAARAGDSAGSRFRRAAVDTARGVAAYGDLEVAERADEIDLRASVHVLLYRDDALQGRVVALLQLAVNVRHRFVDTAGGAIVGQSRRAAVRGRQRDRGGLDDAGTVVGGEGRGLCPAAGCDGGEGEPAGL